MPEEIFDVVNGRDEVIDRKPRREVHARGLWHRAVHVLVFNARGEIFLQKRSMTKDTAKGLWDSSSSGHVDSGEDYDACAVRELREEIGLELSSRDCPTAVAPRPHQLGSSGRESAPSEWGEKLEPTHVGCYGSGGQSLRRLFKIDACKETGWEFCWVYRCESEGPFQLHPEEIESGGWFAPEKVSRWVAERPQDFASAFRSVWKTFLSQGSTESRPTY